jgi:kynurenine formamidase
VIDVTADVERDPDFLLTPERIDAWELRHGRIPRGSWVLLRTGWSRRTDPAAFLNVAADGPHSPGFDARASRLLASERDVLGVGVETIGTDAGQAGRFDPPFPITASCTARASSVWPASAIWIGCRQQAPSCSPRR